VAVVEVVAVAMEVGVGQSKTLFECFHEEVEVLGLVA
jgi:hypothetical protein